jgi:protein-S-isoprenylcysteine O-methyltransferase Ste14
MSLFFNIVYFCWFASEVILNRVLRAGRGDKQPTGKHSLTYIWVTVIICVIAAVNISQHSYFPVIRSAVIGWAGIGLIILGMALRLTAIISLGRFFTVNVAIREGHTIKQDGMYKYVRHPSYAASLLSFLGFGISLNNWVSLLVVFVPVTIAFLYRIKVEEAMLSAGLGDAYTAYKKRTYRLLPGIY